MLKIFTQGPFSSPCLVLSNALIKTAFLIQATTADWKWQSIEVQASTVPDGNETEHLQFAEIL